ncbi:type III PLP-dependent enzyme [Jatrophihabitans sp.]|uniref:type III PLP-dependent enzyme n=1 Tax=Jatrophihabitans sp. TaxID=1932789 RepID=UPI002BD68DBC|nr:type III PLP-dependent enzyme [Jatrophihabitans sp.]
MSIPVASPVVPRLLPGYWPASLAPARLAIIDRETPFLAFDPDIVAAQLMRFRSALPGVSVHYAMKCNGDETVLRRLHEQGAGFEIASVGELRRLLELGVHAEDVLFSNPVKPPAAIAHARAAGVWRFSFDSERELSKIAAEAPGAAVYLRLRVDDSDSVFPLSRKFGANSAEGLRGLLRARELGLHPYGLTFHVGSQCTRPATWARAVAVAAQLMERLAEHGIVLNMLNLGGGFPAHYGGAVPSISSIGTAISEALEDHLPYQPGLIAAEPGRYLVAESGVLVATVLGRAVRDGQNWLYLDVGAYNGLMETLQTGQTWEFPLWTSRSGHGGGPLESFTVTGPSCDSSDTMFHDVRLPASLDEGDRIYIASAGAYTLSYASTFNGFPLPAAYPIDEVDG